MRAGIAMWHNKNVIVGVTGGIAAYKVASLIRLLVKSGAEVKVIMTPDATNFITPLTLSTLSKNEVYTEFYKDLDTNGTWNNHVELALWADVMLIAPASANTISKMVNGACDNFLMAVYMSAKCPVFYAPAMDLDMYAHPSTARNFNLLESYGNIQIPAEEGELASGLIGKGRMAEPENIISFMANVLEEDKPLLGKTVLLTAGPTYEAIDPVRFIGNHSSGKMGYALAERAAALGADVILISGPVHLEPKNAKIKRISVTTAAEMYEESHNYFPDCQIAILSAAVADYTPVHVADEKIKKKTDEFNLELTKTKDILKSLGEIKTTQFLVGFALETENEVENAKGKLESKNLDLIVLNSLKDDGAGFASDTNKVTLINPNGVYQEFDLKAKTEVAVDIFNYIVEHSHA